MSEAFKQLLVHQKAEITEHNIYSRLSKLVKDKHNSKILKTIGDDELRHYGILEKITKQKIKPNMFKVYWYIFLAKLLGLTFALRLMESGEENAQFNYDKLVKKYPQVKQIIAEEEAHEQKLIGILKDKKLTYAGAIVLGLNDALVELTGTLAGLTLAFANSTIIGVTGLIMGVAASLSMAASGYLSSREDEDENTTKSAITSAMYTGVAYIVTVIFLIAPYFIFSNVFVALSIMLTVGMLIIAAYTKYISVAKGLKFWPRFLQMALISLSVALISFLLGILVKSIFGIEV